MSKISVGICDIDRTQFCITLESRLLNIVNAHRFCEETRTTCSLSIRNLVSL